MRTEDIASGNLGPQLREFRRKKGMTQRELAECCGVSAGYIALLETGRRRSERKILLTICRALDLDGSQTAQLLHGANHTLPSRTLRARVERKLNEALERLQSSGSVASKPFCTFYVRDPYWL